MKAIYHLGHAMEARARIWRQQHRIEDAAFETFRATEIFEKLEATEGVDFCKRLPSRSLQT